MRRPGLAVLTGAGPERRPRREPPSVIPGPPAARRGCRRPSAPRRGAGSRWPGGRPPPRRRYPPGLAAGAPGYERPSARRRGARNRPPAGRRPWHRRYPLGLAAGPPGRTRPWAPGRGARNRRPAGRPPPRLPRPLIPQQCRLPMDLPMGAAEPKSAALVPRCRWRCTIGSVARLNLAWIRIYGPAAARTLVSAVADLGAQRTWSPTAARFAADMPERETAAVNLAGFDQLARRQQPSPVRRSAGLSAGIPGWWAVVRSASVIGVRFAAGPALEAGASCMRASLPLSRSPCVRCGGPYA